MMAIFELLRNNRITKPTTIPQRFLIKLKSGTESSSMPNLPSTRKERDNELDGRIYRQLSHYPLVYNTIPIITEVFESTEPTTPSNLRKVESARPPLILKIKTRGISEITCESERPSPWKKCKLELGAPTQTIWIGSPTCVTCIANDGAGSMESEHDCKGLILEDNLVPNLDRPWM
jgi:hypothetical protein